MKNFARSLRKMIGRHLPLHWKYRLLSMVSKGCLRGPGTYVHPSVQMLGAAHVAIGRNTCIGEQTWLNVNHRNPDEIAIQIGDHCFIGRRNFFSSGRKIEIGHYVLTTVDCKFVCSSHITDDPLVPYILSGTTANQAICIGANCFFGVGAMVLGNVSIGHGSVIGANSIVTQDVPPFSIVAGNPAKILRRYSFSRKSWVAGDSVTDADLQNNPDESAYLDILRRTHPEVPMPFIATGSDWGDL